MELIGTKDNRLEGRKEDIERVNQVDSWAEMSSAYCRNPSKRRLVTATTGPNNCSFGRSQAPGGFLRRFGES